MRDMAPYLEHVLGDTWCIVTGKYRIPLYMPDRSRAVMMDSGLKYPDREGILSLLEREKIRVDSLLTSHSHPDHVGNHSAIRAAHGCTVYMAPFMALAAQDPTALQSYGYEAYARHTSSRKLPAPDRIIPRDAEAVEASGASFSLLWLPGHAVEQVGFITPDGVAYLADTLLSEHILDSIRLPFYTCCRLDLEAKESLRNLRCHRYILAHNGVYRDISGLIDRNIAAVREKLDLIQGLCDSWMTVDRLAARVMAHLGLDGNDVHKTVASKRNIRVFMEYLVETGRLEVRASQGYVEYLGTK